jgi:hypothetical protein
VRYDTQYNDTYHNNKKRRHELFPNVKIPNVILSKLRNNPESSKAG